MSKFQLDLVDLNVQFNDEEQYQERLKQLQKQMVGLQNACHHNGQRAVIVLEGWDAAGKGGAIRRLTEKLDPRAYQVHPIGKPDASEQREHYLQRFWRRLPQKGRIAIFDRSWYGRVLVERVEGFATTQEWQRAYKEIADFEKALADDGITVVKLMLHISQKEQLKRYLERLDDPSKHWKLSDEDLRNRARAKEYTKAYEDMLNRTHGPHAPWFVIAGEYKWHARVAVLDTVCRVLENTIDTRVPRYSAQQIAQMKALLGA
ncbi:MAG: polyphosphate kinase [Porticoccaceae bacterium]